MKTKTLSRVLSFLMVLCMVLSMIPVMAFAAEGIYKKTTTIAVGDQVVFVCEGANGGAVEMTSVGTAGTYGSGTAFTGNPAGTLAFNVTAGYGDGTYAFENGGKYVQWTGKNVLYLVDTLDANSSWTVSFDESGNAVILNCSDSARKLQWNYSSPRFAAYTSNQTAIQLYKYETVDCDHVDTEKTTVTVDATCEDAGHTTVTCTCGTVVSVTDIPALGHNLVAGEVTAPDCINAGYTTYICDREGCDYSEKKDETEALGHTFAGGICSVCGATEGTLEKAAAIAVGDIVVIVSEAAGMELTAISTTSTKYGVGTAYTDAPAGTWQWTVCAGTAAGTYAFKNSDGKYLYWGSGNSLNVSDTFDEKTSWNVSIDTEGNATVTNVFDSGRYLYWNSQSPRFACYTDKSSDSKYYLPQLYKISASSDACEHSWSEWTVTKAATCTENGEQTRTCSLCQDVETSAIATVAHNVVDSACTMCGTEFYAAATTINDYDNVVIYYPTAGVALTATASGTKLAGTSVTVDENGLAVTADVAVMQAQYLDGSTTDFYLLCDNMYLTSGATGNSLTFAAEVSDYAVWYLAAVDETSGLVYIHSRNASYNGSSQSMEYYNGFTTYGTKTTNIYQFQLYTKAGEVPTCEHSWGEWATTTEATCTEEGVQTSICSLCGEKKTQAIAAKGHSYIFGDTAATCSACDVEIAKSNIADVKNFTADTIYYFEGVVTYVSGRTTYLEDATGGMCVYYAYNEQQGVALGDTIRVCDSIKNYNGLLETTDTLAVETQKVSTGNNVPVQEVTLAELKADTAVMEYLGENILLKNLNVTVADYSSQYNNVTYTLSDGTNTIEIYRAYAASADVVIPVGTIVNVEAIASAYNGYQLVIMDHSQMEIVGWYHNAAVTEAGKIVATYATALEAYNAYTADGTQYIQILNSTDFETQLTKDLYIDLNGKSIEGEITVGECKIYAIDSATADYTSEGGYLGLTVDGALVEAQTVGNYLMIEGDDGWTFNAYAVELTHVSLDATNDALGYKAQVKGNAVVMENITGFGFNMGVQLQKTYELNGQPTDGIFTLRLKGIMAAGGGEMDITSSAFVILNGETVETATHSTTMKETILAVNELTALSDAQKTAVYNLYAQYSEVMDAWFTAEGKTNNIIGWAPATTEE